MIRIVIFDDNVQRRDGLKMLIESVEGMTCVGDFSDCREVVERIEETMPDVVLMDIDMPHIDGIKGVKHIREVFPDLKILMQTVFEDDDKIFEAVCAGADGYILKQTSPSKLIDAIVEVLEGGAPMTPVIARKVLRLFSEKQRLSENHEFNLTKRELEILAFLVKGYSYKMIANECHISYPTVNSHISNIYGKLKVSSAAGAVSKALRKGLVD